MRVGQDVPVQYLDHNAIPVVGEFLVCRLFGLRIANGSQQDEVGVGLSGLAIRRLLLPVGQRVGLGLIGLVDEQEYAAVSGISDIHVVTYVRDLPASRNSDRVARWFHAVRPSLAPRRRLDTSRSSAVSATNSAGLTASPRLARKSPR